MKIRLGFVSNSSSSSFTCEVCNDVQSGMDASLEDFDMIECEHGHTLCRGHISEQIIAQIEDYMTGEADEYERRLKECACPLCTFKSLSEIDEMRYYRKKLKSNREMTRRELMGKFKTYKDFEASLA